MPILARGERLEGALNVRTREPREFTDDEIELLLAIAAQVAQSIEHAKLYAEAQRRVHELEALARISEAVSESLYLEESLEAIVKTTMDALSATGAALVLEDGKIAWPEGRADAHAIRQPLRWRGRQIGELVADRATPFTQHDRELLASIAQQAAVALEHGRAVMRGVLAQEIHHRVKNNLQTVASLLRLQARADGPVDARKALEDSVNRILAIAAVHEVLTERRDDDVDLADLFERLRAMLVQGVGAGREVDAELEPVSLAGHRATALALVFSELLQNALEHGGQHVHVELARPERRGRARDRRRRPGDRGRADRRHRPLDRPRARPRRAARHARPPLGAAARAPRCGSRPSVAGALSTGARRRLACRREHEVHVVAVRVHVEDLVAEHLGRGRVEADARAAALDDLVAVLGRRRRRPSRSRSPSSASCATSLERRRPSASSRDRRRRARPLSRSIARSLRNSARCGS